MDERWTREHSSLGRATVIDGTVVSIDDPDNSLGRVVFGVDAQTGEELWRATPDFGETREAPRILSVVAGAETVYCVVGGGATFAVDPTDGTVLWELDPAEGNTLLTAGCALADDLLVTIGARRDDELGSVLYAIS